MSKLDSVQMMTLLSKYQNQIHYYYVDYESLSGNDFNHNILIKIEPTFHANSLVRYTMMSMFRN